MKQFPSSLPDIQRISSWNMSPVRPPIAYETSNIGKSSKHAMFYFQKSKMLPKSWKWSIQNFLGQLNQKWISSSGSKVLQNLLRRGLHWLSYKAFTSWRITGKYRISRPKSKFIASAKAGSTAKTSTAKTSTATAKFTAKAKANSRNLILTAKKRLTAKAGTPTLA